MKFSLFVIIFISWTSLAFAKWTVTAYNIRNFDKDRDAGPTNIAELTKIIREVKSDVMAFEEVVNDKAFDSLITNGLPGYSYKLSKCGGFGRQKVAIVFNPATFEFVSEIEDLSFSGKETSCGSLRSVLLITLKEKQTGKLYTFGAIHLKAGGDASSFQKRWQQYEKLKKLSNGYDDKNLVLLGDFNTTGYNIKNEDYVKFEDFISSSKLKTMSESLGCTSYWTGTAGGPEHESSILDHIVIQDKNVSSVASVKVTGHCARLDCRPATPEDLGISYETVSDHCPVQVSFK